MPNYTPTPSHVGRRKRRHQLAEATHQRNQARGRLGELYVWRARAVTGQTAHGIDHTR